MKYVVIGIITGIANGLFGSGGGTIAVPAMVHFLGADEHKAHATAISVILPLTLVSSVYYISKGYADWGLTLKVTIGGLVGGYVGARLLNVCPEKWLRRIFAIFMAAAGVRMILQGEASERLVFYIDTRTIILFLIGLAAGIISGMGMGGGAILIPALVLAINPEQHIAQSVNLLFFVPTAVIALIIHIKNKRIDFKMAWPIIISGLCGAFFGSMLASQLGGGQLKKLFGYFLIAMSIYELFRKGKSGKARTAKEDKKRA